MKLCKRELPDFICPDMIAHENMGYKYTQMARDAMDEFSRDQSRDHHSWKPDWEILDNDEHTFELNAFSRPTKEFRPMHSNEAFIRIPSGQLTSNDLTQRFETSYNIHADMLRYLATIPPLKRGNKNVDSAQDPLVGTFTVIDNQHVYGICRSVRAPQKLADHLQDLRSSIPQGLRDTFTIGYSNKHLSICRQIKLPQTPLDSTRMGNNLNDSYCAVYTGIVETVKDLSDKGKLN